MNRVAVRLACVLVTLGLVFAMRLAPTAAAPPSPPPPLVGDVNGDDAIDLYDLTAIARSYAPGRPPSDPRADVNGDGQVDLFDLVLVAIRFGGSAPQGPWVAPAPQPTAQPLPTPTPVLYSGGAEAEFKSYLRRSYSTIAGQVLEIEDIYIGNEGGQYPLRWISIDLTRHSSLYVFAEQTKAAALAYGRSLLKDTIKYFGGQDCSAYVDSTWYTFHLADSYFDEEWYYIGDFDVDDGWYISKDYVKAYYRNGIEEVEVWNYK